VKLDRSSNYKNYLKLNYGIAVLVFCLTPINIVLHLGFNTTVRGVLGIYLSEDIFMTFQYCAFVLTVIAFFISIVETYRYKKLVQDELTDYGMLQINWLWQFIFILFPIILLWGFELGHIISGGTGPSDFLSITWFFVFIFLYFFSFKAYRNPNLFDHISKNIRKEIGVENEKKEKHPCTKENSSKIISEMEDHKLYLNEELTLNTFAKEINMSSRLISSCINNNLGHNFNEWVNNYRVEKALQIIQSDKKNTLSIEGIGSDSGFKSRSAMYAAFKKKLGHSPGFYRNN
jgi:AraC-like DNA-binding protein